MKYLVKISLFVSLVLSLASCRTNKQDRNYVFFPNMYEEVGYDTYLSSNITANGSSAAFPAAHTIARGVMPYDYPNTIQGKEDARVQPIPFEDLNSEENLATGKELYTIYCSICHGAKGNGQGNLVKREKFLGVPSYGDVSRNITAGTTYHAIYYGLNSMGSYKNQLNFKERWLVANYVVKLKEDLTK